MIYAKTNVQSLNQYIVDTSDYIVKLDANESENYLMDDNFKLDLSDIYLYPDHNQTALKKALETYVGVSELNYTFGNGSSELIELMFKAYVNPQDIVLTYEPTFSMYKVYSELYQANYQSVKTKDFKVDTKEMIKAIKQYNPKMTILCSPNNPTGYLIPKHEIIDMVKSTEHLILLDEAYIDFVDEKQSLLDVLSDFPNLVIVRTLSKAFGLAGIRLGYMFASHEIIQTIEKVKAPYHLNALTQKIGAYALQQKDKVNTFTKTVIQRRILLKKALEELGMTCYPSDANFIFIRSNMTRLDLRLKEKGILIRGFNTLKDYYRITVGNTYQNEMLIQYLKEIIREN